MVLTFRKPRRSHTQLIMDELAESAAHLRLAAGHAAGGAQHRLGPAIDMARTAANRGMTTTRGSLSPIYDQMRGATGNRFTAPFRSMSTGSASGSRRGGNTGSESRRGFGLWMRSTSSGENGSATKMGRGWNASGAGTDGRRRRWPMVLGIVAAGAAVGAVGAMAARRQRETAGWDEYGPSDTLDSGLGEPGFGDSEGRRVSTARKKVAASAASVADTVSVRAGRIADSLHNRGSRGGGVDPLHDPRSLTDDRLGEPTRMTEDAASRVNMPASSTRSGQTGM
jgi:hypothetical protein